MGITCGGDEWIDSRGQLLATAGDLEMWAGRMVRFREQVELMEGQL